MRVRGPLLRVIQNFRLAVLTGLIRIGALEINEGATPGRGIPRVTDSGGILCGSRRDDAELLKERRLRAAVSWMASETAQEKHPR